jgi:hypothetical protein
MLVVEVRGSFSPAAKLLRFCAFSIIIMLIASWSPSIHPYSTTTHCASTIKLK